MLTRPLSNSGVERLSSGLRINGAKEFNETSTEASGIGAGSNPVDSMPKIGLKKKNIEAEVSDREHLNG